jgi:hypothetical protein
MRARSVLLILAGCLVAAAIVSLTVRLRTSAASVSSRRAVPRESLGTLASATGQPIVAQLPPAPGARQEAPASVRAPAPTPRRVSWEERAAAFAAERRNNAWAGPREAMLTRELDEAAAAMSATLIEVDCRSAQCRAAVSWIDGLPPHRDSVLRLVAAARSMSSCVRGFRPDDADPTTTILLFECPST